jgi:hypothetical protein
MLAQVEDQDADLADLTWRAWFNTGSANTWMAVRDARHLRRCRRLCLHREVALRMSGLDPRRVRVKPRDGNFLNCIRSNLDVFTQRNPRPKATGYVYFTSRFSKSNPNGRYGGARAPSV